MQSSFKRHPGFRSYSPTDLGPSLTKIELKRLNRERHRRTIADVKRRRHG